MLQHSKFVYEIGSSGDLAGIIGIQSIAIMESKVIGTAIPLVLHWQLRVAAIMRTAFQNDWFRGSEPICGKRGDLLLLLVKG